MKTKENPRQETGANRQIKYTPIPAQGVRFISADDYARIFGVTGNTVRVRCRKGEIPGAIKEGKLWRIPIMQEA